ncbi:hypothetical protein [Yoonia sp. BS5-3]|uniref:Uncharacterized protein n=1 Tax=Yoonia phaeophyticola TaxID=3137369 RepID=A0ABZ2V5Y6_9RHOB
MQFEWPTPEQIIYRVTRLRRLVVLAVAMPVCVLLLTALMDPMMISPNRAMIGAIAIALLVVGHVSLFPNVTLETLSLSVSLSLLVISVSWIKTLAGMFPAENASAAYAMLVTFAVLGAGAIMWAVRAVLTALTYAGPALRLRVGGRMDIACSVGVAHRQFALQPETRRGRILCGPADSDGLFDVAIVAPQVADPEAPDQPFVARVAARVLHSDENSHQVMLVLGDGSVAATSQTFTQTPHGCRVTVSEMPGDFTLGMHLMFWLADQQADNMTEIADTILSEPARANGLAHGVSFLSVAAAVLSPRDPAVKRAK